MWLIRLYCSNYPPPPPTPTPTDNYIFETQPERYYYQVVGKAILIPCKAVLERDDGSTQITSPTLLVNSEPVDIYARDTRYYAWATDGEVSGLLLTPVMVEDSGKTVECAVIVNNQTEVSVQTIIYVGGTYVYGLFIAVIYPA